MTVMRGRHTQRRRPLTISALGPILTGPGKGGLLRIHDIKTTGRCGTLLSTEFCLGVVGGLHSATDLVDMIEKVRRILVHTIGAASFEFLATVSAR
jgi:hypothetical protein